MTSALQDLCEVLSGIDRQILDMAQQLASESTKYSQAAARAAAAARQAEGPSAAGLARTAVAFDAAARACGQGAQLLHAAAREGQAFIARTAVASSAAAKAGHLADTGQEDVSIEGTIRDVSDTIGCALASLSRWNSQDRETCRRWFGTDDEHTRNVLIGRLQACEKMLPQLTIRMAPPETAPTVFAFVYPNDPSHSVFLGPQFRQATRTPPDSRSGTLLHEVSHFTDVGATNDWVYGAAAAKRLALASPAHALSNADNFEYYCEEFTP